MLLQFTTGSVERRHAYGLRVSVLNTRLRPAQIAIVFRCFGDDWHGDIFEDRITVQPNRSVIVLDKSGLDDAHCELLLKVDSPSLVVTIVGETRYPLHCQTLCVDDIDTPVDDLDLESKSHSLLWGYAAKGDPF